MRICAPLRTSALPALQWIEATSRFQIPSFHVVGLASQEVHEARERVRSAIDACGWEFPRRKVVVNLSPADIRKQGTGTDLAIALAIRALGEDRLPPRVICATGELGLQGVIKPSGRVLHALVSCKLNDVSRLLISTQELALARAYQQRFPELGAVTVDAAETLSQAWQRLMDPSSAPERWEDPRALPVVHPDSQVRAPLPELEPIEPRVQRVLMAAIAGRHHCVLLGPRGSGKSQALAWAARLLPKPSSSEALHRALLHESREEMDLPRSIVVVASPLVRPAALLGQVGRSEVRPGLLALAHSGVLIADELPEWSRDARECLRAPMEEKRVRLQRAQATVEFPADFRILGSGNLCDCGGTPPDSCRCSIPQRRKYSSRLSGPLLDRTDLVVLLREPPREKRRTIQLDETAEQVQRTRERLIEAYGALPSSLPAQELESLLQNIKAWVDWDDQQSWSSLRGRHRVAATGLTFAAVEGNEPVSRHFAEGLLYRAERLREGVLN